MKNLKRSKLLPAMLVVMLSVLAASAQQPQPPKNSVESSPSSGTVVSEKLKTRSEKLLSACNAVADELRASRILTDALETENAALRSRLETERSATRLLTELNDTRRRESEALKETVNAKNETIAAKDTAIAAQDRLIEHLKTKKRSVWSRIADIAIGAGIGLILK